MQSNLVRLEAAMRKANRDTSAADTAWSNSSEDIDGGLYAAYEAAYDRFAGLAMDVADAPASQPSDVATKLRSLLFLLGTETTPVDAIERMAETALAAVAPPMTAAA